MGEAALAAGMTLENAPATSDVVIGPGRGGLIRYQEAVSWCWG